MWEEAGLRFCCSASHFSRDPATGNSLFTSAERTRERTTHCARQLSSSSLKCFPHARVHNHRQHIAVAFVTPCEKQCPGPAGQGLRRTEVFSVKQRNFGVSGGLDGSAKLFWWHLSVTGAFGLPLRFVLLLSPPRRPSIIVEERALRHLETLHTTSVSLPLLGTWDPLHPPSFLVRVERQMIMYQCL